MEEKRNPYPGPIYLSCRFLMKSSMVTWSRSTKSGLPHSGPSWSSILPARKHPGRSTPPLCAGGRGEGSPGRPSPCQTESRKWVWALGGAALLTRCCCCYGGALAASCTHAHTHDSPSPALAGKKTCWVPAPPCLLVGVIFRAQRADFFTWSWLTSCMGNHLTPELRFTYIVNFALCTLCITLTQK